MLKMIRRIKLFTLVVIISLIAVQSMAEIKADSLILGLLFEGNAKDVSGSGVGGKVEGGAKFVAGKFGKAIQLDGKDDVVKIDKKLVILKKSVLSIGCIQLGGTVNGASFLTITAGQWGISITSYIPIKKSNSVYILMLEAVTHLLLR